MTWHIPGPILHDYMSGSVGDADAWSVEAHLMTCEECRLASAQAALTESATLREGVWEAISGDLPPQGSARPGTRLREASMMVVSGPAARWAWLASCALVVVLAAVLAVSEAAGTAPWLGVLAPLLPLLGVAMSYGSGLDHSYEVIASTPGGGFRLLLIRTATVLAVTTPSVFIAGLLIGYGTPVPWLAASLGLTLLTLALGSAIGVEGAAAVVGVGWVVATAGPLLRSSGVPVWLDERSTPMWLALIAVAAVLVALRRGSFNQLNLPNTKGEVAN